MDISFTALQPLLDTALTKRRLASPLRFEGTRHEEAFRLFNGFYEGYPGLVLDVYAQTLILHDYASPPNPALIHEVVGYTRASLPWLQTGILKTRHAETQQEKNGKLIFGNLPARKIKEHGIWYALDLQMNRDASFYLDTKNLRKWLMEHTQGKSVLNTFAYTGSLGIAALAGGASQVVQTDLNRQFLNLAKDSLSINGFNIQKKDFIAQDFFPAVARFKANQQIFDCVIIDPPFFSTTQHGKVDLEQESTRLINKVRPLICDGGLLIAINNAIYVSGANYMQSLETLCKDGYMKVQELIEVPEDFIGLHRLGAPITDPAPFNHSTKMAILSVRRK